MQVSPHLLSPSMLYTVYLWACLLLKPPALQLCILLFVVCSVVSKVPSLVVVKYCINVVIIITCLGTLTASHLLAVRFWSLRCCLCCSSCLRKGSKRYWLILAALCRNLIRMYKPKHASSSSFILGPSSSRLGHPDLDAFSRFAFPTLHDLVGKW